MAFFKVGNFAKATAVGAQVVTHTLGEVPKIIIIWGSPATADTELAGAQIGYGTTTIPSAIVASSFSIASGDALTTSASWRSRKASSIHIVNTAGTTVVEATVTAATTANFTLNWTTNNATAYRLHYVVIGGPATQAKLLHQTLGTGILKAVAGFGFPVENFMMQSVTTNAGISGAHLMMTAKAASSTSVAITAFDDNAIAAASQHARSNNVANDLLDPFTPNAFAGYDQWFSYLNTYDADGFTIADQDQKLNGMFATTLGLKGLKMEVGNISRTHGATSSSATFLPWRPEGIIFFATGVEGTAPGPDAGSVLLGLMIGATDGTTTASTYIGGKNAISPTDTWTDDRNNALVIASWLTKAVDTLGTVVLDPTGFTINWSLSSVDYMTDVMYVAFRGNDPPTATGVTVSDTTSGTPRIAWTFNDVDPGNTQSAQQVKLIANPNLLTANQSNVETDTTGFTTSVPQLNPGSTIARVTTDKWQGTASLAVTCTAASRAQGVTTTDTTAQAGLLHTASTYVKAPVGQAMQITLRDNANAVETFYSWSASGAWERVSLSVTAGSVSTPLLRFTVRTDVAAAITFNIDGLQLEPGSIATPWSVGNGGVVSFDSGKIVSSSPFYDILYANKLQPDTQYFALVNVWDDVDAISPAAGVGWRTPKAYQATGTYTTEVFNPALGATTRTGILTWNALTPVDTTLSSEYRISADNVTWGAWTAVANGGTVPATNYAQTRFNFATIYGLASAELLDMKLQFQGDYYATGTWVSNVIAINEFYSGTLNWTDVVPAGTSLSMDYRTDPVAGAWTAIAKGAVIPWAAGLQLRATLTPSVDLHTTPRLTSLTMTGTAAYRTTGSWISPSISLLNDAPSSGIATWTTTLNGGSVVVETRSSINGANWSAWVPVAASGGQIPTLDGLEVQTQITINRGSPSTTPLVSRLTDTITNVGPRGVWTSPSIDISQVAIKTSGKITLDVTANGGSVSSLYRYSSNSGATWSAWTSVLSDGSLAAVPTTATHVQLLLIINNKAELKLASLSLDGTPTINLISTTMTPNTDYDFAQLKDNLIVVNGVDAPRKWDGTTFALVGGSPPTMSLVETHLNKVWGVEASNPSRVRWSETLNFDLWPALNFIDFNPEDGTRITALYRAGTNLLIGKAQSMALLVGDRDTNFSVLWLDAHERGPTGLRTVASLDRYLVYVASDGIRFSDLTKSVLNSVKLVDSWEKDINHQRLNKAAVVYWNQYLMVALPSTGSLVNDVVWVLDTLRNAWSRIVGWNVSSWFKFQQYGEETLLAGDSVTGQVYQVLTGNNDDGQNVLLDWQSGNIDVGYPERYKLFGNHTVTVEGKPEAQTLSVFYDVVGGTDPATGEFVDGKQTFAVTPITVPAGDEVTHIYRILPPVWGAVLGRAISVRLLTGANVHSMTLDITVRGIVPGGL